MKNSMIDKLSLFFFSLCLVTIGYMLYVNWAGQFEKHPHWVYAVDNNQQGITASASNNELLLWEKRSCIGRLVEHTDAIKTVAFSPGGQLIVSGGMDKSVKIWNWSQKRMIKTLKGHTEGVNKVAFSVSGKYIVSAGYDNQLYIHDWENDNILKSFPIKHSYFSISKSDILAYVDTSCNLTLFDLSSLQLVKVVGPFCGAPVFHPQKDIIALNEINKSNFTFVDINTNRVLRVLNIKQKNSALEVETFKFTPDGQYIVAALWGGDIQIWNWQQKVLTRTLQAHDLSSVHDLSFTKENELISASGDKSLKYWNWNTGQLKMVIGNGLFQAKLNGLLALLILLTLISGFWVIAKSSQNTFSSFTIGSILTVWSVGLFLLLNLFKSKLAKVSTAVSWTATIISTLFFLSSWFAWLAIFTIPIALIFCYIKLISAENKRGIYLALGINLLYCGVCSYFVAMMAY
jgi:WD40 repeat protein